MSLKPYRRNARGPAVLFVKADWCPHCREMKPEMQKAAALLGSVVPVYAVDSEKHEDVIQKMGVDGFPTIFYMDREGKLTMYREESRTGRKIADWACAHSGNCGRSKRA